LLEPGTAGRPPLGPQVDPAVGEQVERDVRRRRRRDQLADLDRGRDQAALQLVEAEPAVEEDDQLAIDDGAIGQLAGGGRGDVGEPVGEVLALARPDPCRRTAPDDDPAAS
jgi:hypothetical protein